LKKKILIIGGTGFLGYHLAHKCILKGWEVTSISKSMPKKIRFLSKVKYLLLDITKKKSIREKISCNYDYIVNFAGHSRHNDRLKTYSSHYIGCKNIVDFFLNKKIKLFVQIGSCYEYEGNKISHKEDQQTNIKKLKSIYGKAKLAATNYLLKKIRKKNFPFIILRPYWIYGPKQDFNRFMPIIIRGCLQNTHFSCSAGTQYRDFVYIDDFISAIFKSLKNKNLIGHVFNVGSGKKTKIKKIIILINRLIKSGKPDFGKIKLREDEILKSRANILKLKKMTGWAPKISLMIGIKKTINSYKKIF
jgi:UDP-glucose 4-epimerase